MPFVKGHKKLGGRAKGQVSSEKKLAREIIEGVLKKTIPERLLEIAQRQPAKETEILLALLPYCYPKLQSMEVAATLEANISAELALDQAMQELDKLMAIRSEMKK